MIKKTKGEKFGKKERKIEVQKPKYPAEDLVRFQDLTDYEARKLYIKEQISPKTLFTEDEFAEIIEKRFGKRR